MTEEQIAEEVPSDPQTPEQLAASANAGEREVVEPQVSEPSEANPSEDNEGEAP